MPHQAGKCGRPERIERPCQLAASLPGAEKIDKPREVAGPRPHATPFRMLCAANVDKNVAHQRQQRQTHCFRYQPGAPQQRRPAGQHEPQQRWNDKRDRHQMRQRKTAQEGQRQQISVARRTGSLAAIHGVLHPFPAKRQPHDGQRLRDCRGILLGADSVVPEEVGYRIECPAQKAQRPAPGQIDDQLVKQPQRQQRPDG